MPATLTKKTVQAYALSVLPLLCEMLPTLWRVRDVRIMEKIKADDDEPGRLTMADVEWHGERGDAGGGGPEVTICVSMEELRDTADWRPLVIARIVHELGHVRTIEAADACEKTVDEALKDRRRIAKKIKRAMDDIDDAGCVSLEVLIKYFLVNNVQLP